MRKKKKSDDEYDYSRVGYARRHAIRTLDEYECSNAEIIAMFGCSQATFYRYDQGVRLSRRPPRSKDRPEIPPDEAREIVLIALIRAGYEVAEISPAIGISPATVYRERTDFFDRQGAASPAERRFIHRHLKKAIRDTRRPVERRRDARQRRQRWLTRSRGNSSS